MMNIKVGYVDGERVYAFHWDCLVARDKKYDFNDCQIIKHRDIVKSLNKFLKRIEEADDQVMQGDYGMILWGLIAQFDHWNKENFPPYRVMNEAEVNFDNKKMIKETTMPRLKFPRRTTTQTRDLGKFKVIAGGRAAAITY